MAADDDTLEIPLIGGADTSSVVRVGDTVRRPRRPWWRSIHAFLSHLDAVGFAGAPQILGIDEEGREVLTFHPGTLEWPDAPDLFSSDASLKQVAALVRDFHRAGASFVPPTDARWSDRLADPAGGAIVMHNDLAPWNFVVGEERSVIIDWDYAAPGRIEWELAYTIHTFVPLWPISDPRARSGLSDDEIERRVGVFAEAYELSTTSLQLALSLIPERCQRNHDVRPEERRWEEAATYVRSKLPTLLRRLT
jgi:Ser/Thr protein kinase RdoA (MazF antagonist)